MKLYTFNLAVLRTSGARFCNDGVNCCNTLKIAMFGILVGMI